jgi:hypothetical protein
VAEEAELIAQHYAAPTDAKWAAAAEASLASDFESLSALPNAGFKLVNTDCRTDSCVAMLEWDSFNQANGRTGLVVHHHYALNCAREIRLADPPGEPGSSYSTTVLFDCTELRAGR